MIYGSVTSARNGEDGEDDADRTNMGGVWFKFMGGLNKR